MKRKSELTLVPLLLAIAQAAAAAPVGCISGFQDNTCITSISSAPQTPPTCPSSAGWIQTVPARWIGSRYTSPQCSYQAPPTCPGGYTQTSAPWWNGSGWVGLACTPSVPPAPQCNDQPTRALLITWAPVYGYSWYSEGFVQATRRVCDGVPQWSTLVRNGGDLLLQEPLKAYHVPNLTGPDGVPIFAADYVCYGGPSHSFNGENGPQPGQLASPPFAASPSGYGIVSSSGQCSQDTTTP